MSFSSVDCLFSIYSAFTSYFCMVPSYTLINLSIYFFYITPKFTLLANFCITRKIIDNRIYFLLQAGYSLIILLIDVLSAWFWGLNS